jgi:hypothetical protein
MSGEINGTKALLLLGDNGNFSQIIGQGDLTNTTNGAPIDISSRDSDWTVLMDGENSGKGATIAVNLIYSSASTYQEIRRIERAREIAEFKVSYNENDEVDIFVSGMVNALSDGVPWGDKVSSTFNLMSTGEVFRSQYFSALGTDRFITSDSKQLRVRYV